MGGKFHNYHLLNIFDAWSHLILLFLCSYALFMEEIWVLKTFNSSGLMLICVFIISSGLLSSWVGQSFVHTLLEYNVLLLIFAFIGMNCPFLFRIVLVENFLLLKFILSDIKICSHLIGIFSLYSHSKVLPKFKKAFFYDYVENMVYAIVPEFFPFIYAYNLKIWSFRGPTILSYSSPRLSKIFIFFYHVVLFLNFIFES